MKINRALITAAGSEHRKLLLQTLINRDRKKKTVLEILIDEIYEAGIEEIGVVVQPNDVIFFEQALANGDKNIQFIPQTNPNGYGHAILSAKEFLNNQPFLHLVGDHLYISKPNGNMAGRVIEMAKQNKCSVSAVQPIREHSIVNYGAIGANRLHGKTNLFQISQVKEKPTPTYAEQHLMISGIRAGYYLCFYGMHVFTPSIVNLLDEAQKKSDDVLGLSESLNVLAKQSKYLALEMDNLSYDIDQDYGLLKAQLALSLSGQDRDYVLSELMQMFIEREKLNNGNCQ